MSARQSTASTNFVSVHCGTGVNCLMPFTGFARCALDLRQPTSPTRALKTRQAAVAASRQPRFHSHRCASQSRAIMHPLTESYMRLFHPHAAGDACHKMATTQQDAGARLPQPCIARRYASTSWDLKLRDMWSVPQAGASMDHGAAPWYHW
jgi:hypothetical protein